MPPKGPFTLTGLPLSCTFWREYVVCSHPTGWPFAFRQRSADRTERTREADRQRQQRLRARKKLKQSEVCFLQLIMALSRHRTCALLLPC